MTVLEEVCVNSKYILHPQRVMEKANGEIKQIRGVRFQRKKIRTYKSPDSLFDTSSENTPSRQIFLSLMRRSNCSAPIPLLGTSLFLCCPGLFITSFFPCPALNDHENHPFFECPALFYHTHFSSDPGAVPGLSRGVMGAEKFDRRIRGHSKMTSQCGREGSQPIGDKR